MMYIDICKHIPVYVVYICIYIYVHINTYICIYLCTYIHIHTYNVDAEESI